VAGAGGRSTRRDRQELAEVLGSTVIVETRSFVLDGRRYGFDGAAETRSRSAPSFSGLGIERAHAKFTGTHTHSHSAFGSQGGDRAHTHEHTHEGDAAHAHHASGDVDAGDEHLSLPRWDRSAERLRLERARHPVGHPLHRAA
jgi:hypothetical protein